MYRFILNSRYIRFLQHINNNSPSIADISKYTGFNYNHVITILREFQKEGIIKPIFDVVAVHKQNPGNPYIVELTEKGQSVNILLCAFESIESNNQKTIGNVITKLGGKK